jgi:hypothetical protein
MGLGFSYRSRRVESYPDPETEATARCGSRSKGDRAASPMSAASRFQLTQLGMVCRPGS